MKLKLHPLFIIICFCIPSLVFSSTPNAKEEEKIIIEESVQKLTFFINKRKELLARLSVSQKVTSKTNLPYTFSRSVSFDENSQVGNIKKVLNRRTRSIEPIISDYESDGIFHSDLKICYFEHQFNSIDETVTFNYEIVFTDLKFLDPLYFNDNYMVEDSKVIIEVPEWATIDVRELNFDLEQPKYSTTKDKDLQIHTYSLRDLPPAFRYKGAPRRSKINAHLIVISNAYQVDGKSRKLIEGVDDLYSWYASLVAQIGNDNTDLNTLVDELTSGKAEDLEKIKSIFYWVQDNVRYIAFENGIMGFKPENCQSVFSNKYGDCKGMANLTKEMLKIAGYDARLTWLGTADVPYDYDIPSLLVDNHMICTVILDGKKIFLDPTEKYANLYNYAFRIQGQQALIEDGDKFILERIPSLDPYHNKESSTQIFSINKDKLEGKGKVTFQGNSKTYIFNILSSYAQSDWGDLIKNYISNGNKNVQIKLSAEPVLDNRDDDYELAYDIQLDNHIIDLGNELYINLESDYQFKNFDMPEERDVPYQFRGKYFIEHNSSLAIPEGWEVNYLPEAINVDHEKYTFSLFLKEENGQVAYQKSIAIKDPLLTVADFKEWNQLIEKLTAFYADQIILNKK